ncbi:hypothetical protein CY34DRAFT_296078 [Suillus luteus UH-Slu-Lm8-n1]|uniref:Uncharacterized protein n=1 Tax=Suillus luteus UH-Slu-Lm8-n1 TaxID=930992 RepID=A0A0D0AE59_9AGAM|nr:hypothetical protein CY34DRAFT_296078 [Suillus luteus UH-Slu-Lm8-n1]
MNLFTRELIDTARLVREARNFLGDAELMCQFREILWWDGRREREQWVLEDSQQQQTWARAQGQGGPLIVPIHPGRVNAGLQQGGYNRMPNNVRPPSIHPSIQVSHTNHPTSSHRHLHKTRQDVQRSWSSED